MAPLVVSLLLGLVFLGWRLWLALNLVETFAKVTIAVLLRKGPATALTIERQLELIGIKLRPFYVSAILRSGERAGVFSHDEEPGGPERGGRPRFVYRVKNLSDVPWKEP